MIWLIVFSVAIFAVGYWLVRWNRIAGIAILMIWFCLSVLLGEINILDQGPDFVLPHPIITRGVMYIGSAVVIAPFLAILAVVLFTFFAIAAAAAAVAFSAGQLVYRRLVGTTHSLMSGLSFLPTL